VGGHCYCYLFENQLTGISRGVFWSFEVSFEDLVVAGESWPVSLLVEWLTWPIRDWRELERCTLASVERSGLPESSIYLGGAHQGFQLDDLSLTHLGCATFRLTVLGTFSVTDPTGQKHGPVCKSLEASVPFTGAVVVPENLSSKPNTAIAATRELAAFLDTDAFDAPKWDRFRFVYPPRGVG
jgi:hypothetical protein